MKITNSLNPSIDLKEYLQLYDYLEGYLVFISDLDGKYLYFNQECKEYFGITTNYEFVGKNEKALSHSIFADNYSYDNKLVLEKGQKVIDRPELIMNSKGVTRWHLTTKLPLCNRNGSVVGLIGFSKSLVETQKKNIAFEDFREVLSFIDKNIASNIEVAPLARKMNLSLSTFERRFKKTFHMTPKQYIHKAKISATCRELKTSAKTVTQIAYDYGYSDQSHFCKIFNKIMGISPLTYRKS